MNRNLIPGAEGLVDADVFQKVTDELADVLEPVLDRHVDIADGIEMGTQALGALSALREIPSEHRAKVGAAALAVIAATIGADAVAVYPEEAAAG